MSQHAPTRVDSVAHATADYLEDEILRRVKDRGWYRQHRSLAWPDWEQENKVILRTLLRIRRQARQMAEAVPTLADDEWDVRKARYDSEQDMDRYELVMLGRAEAREGAEG